MNASIDPERLIDRIYEAGLIPSLWPALLGELGAERALGERRAVGAWGVGAGHTAEEIMDAPATETGNGARQVRIAFAPSLSQENRHELVIFDGIDRACVAIPHAEQKAAVAADRCTEFTKQGWPKGRNEPRLVDAVDQGFEISQLILPLWRDTIP